MPTGPSCIEPIWNGPNWTSTGSIWGNRSARAIGSAIAVWGHQELADVTTHALLERDETGLVAGGAEPVELRLGEILVFLAQLHRGIDIVDARLLVGGGEHGGRQLGEAARLTRADIEQAGHGRMVIEPEQHRDTVADPDEVALLGPVRDLGAGRAGQPGRPAR